MPIALTEAFGCNRCQQLFVVEDHGYVLEQLSTSYPYKRAWRWMGNRWVVAQSRSGQGFLYIAIAIIVFLLIVTIFLALRSSNGPIIPIWVVVLAVLLILLAIMFWLTYRR